MNNSEENNNSEQGSVDRRKFLQIAASGAAALAGSTTAMSAQQARPPSAEIAVNDAGALAPIRAGSDFMLDVIKSLGFEYVAANPGSSYRSLHESTINYGMNRDPELLTCLHEEAAVAMAHGYFKIEGRPMLVYAYGSVGLQHAAMAIYSAYCDRVPVILFVGNDTDAMKRVSRTDIVHTAQDVAALVRDFTKWDDAPASHGHFAESAVRAYKIAMTPPTLPVVLSVDKYLQELPIPEDAKLRIPKLSPTLPPQGDSAAVKEIAKMLVNADFPVLAVERAARTPAGLQYLVELAELLQAAVVDTIQRMNFPSRHPLNQAEGRGPDLSVISDADVILALEHPLLWGVINAGGEEGAPSRSRLKPGAKLISISSGRYQEVDMALAADAEETLPLLIEEVKRLITSDRKRAFEARGAKLAAASQRRMEQNRVQATYGWDDSPISTARIAVELWSQIKNKDWSLVSRSDAMNGWAQRFWKFEKYYHHIGQSGSVAIGYSAPASVGAALANRKYGRLSINLQHDGDLMYLPGVLWTAAHHRIPMLTIMHNNRAYNTEVMQVERIAGLHHRDIGRCRIGTAIEDPNIDYAKLAQSMGWYAEGPITDPKELGPAIRRALAVVEKGEPALLDAVTQPV
ncbi:MAG: thiamine pyrophosphate-binding protein [Acidobacteria bacterium]|nr:MAG: thiamine pyrophosphate-binding protein [Acidobacteriota bacterium]